MKNQIRIETGKVRFPAAPELYGLFFEDINRAADGGLYPEALRNRSFEDSLVPEGCETDENHVIYLNDGKWPGIFNHGEGMDEWAAAVPFTEIPAWYAENAVMELVTDDTLNPKRKAALRVRFEAGGSIRNIGYCGISAREGESFRILFFAKSGEPLTLTWKLVSKEGKLLGAAEFQVSPEAGSGYQKYEGLLTSSATDHQSSLVIEGDPGSEVLFGFTSLIPSKTFMGHGLREDLAMALKNTHGRFIRFPGGCVVEGINDENTLRFSNTVGPVWERPSAQLMWHYRTTNGLGFHEYLQLCEDLGMEALYVLNCGISCQARHGHGFSRESTDSYLQEALWALEYALGGADTRWGRLRAEAGHPAPFKLKYVEIGNENHGPEYFERYKLFYDTLKAAYPDVIYISNSHTERQGLTTEFADEHYYDAPEFFLEHGDLFDSYDRSGPEIFVGEYAVNGGNTIASMECGLAEASFLLGMERNQDIVKLSAYAPLFQNADYTAWKPNLIVFNNHEVYGIPSYHAISLLGKYRGKEVVELSLTGPAEPPKYQGVPGIRADNGALLFKNVKINGEPAELSKLVYGEVTEADGAYRLAPGGKPHSYEGKCREWNEAFAEFRAMGGIFVEKPFAWAVFGKEDMTDMVFSADVKAEKEVPVTFSVWNYYPDTDAGCNEPKDPDWTPRGVRSQKWRLENGVSTVRVPGFMDAPLSESEKAYYEADPSEFHHYEIRADRRGYKCLIDGKQVQTHVLPEHPLLSAVALQDEEHVYLKLVNASETVQETEISLDCAVRDAYTAEVLSAPLTAVNSFEQPDNVSPVLCSLSGASRAFTYQVPAHSVQVLVLEKAKS